MPLPPQIENAKEINKANPRSCWLRRLAEYASCRFIAQMRENGLICPRFGSITMAGDFVRIDPGVGSLYGNVSQGEARIKSCPVISDVSMHDAGLSR